MRAFLLKTTSACHKAVPALRLLAGVAPDQEIVIPTAKKLVMSATDHTFAEIYALPISSGIQAFAILSVRMIY